MTVHSYVVGKEGIGPMMLQKVPYHETASEEALSEGDTDKVPAFWPETDPLAQQELIAADAEQVIQESDQNRPILVCRLVFTTCSNPTARVSGPLQQCLSDYTSTAPLLVHLIHSIIWLCSPWSRIAQSPVKYNVMQKTKGLALTYTKSAGLV